VTDPNADAAPTAFRSGFATIVGRPNVGKSTLVNALLGTKVAIVSDKPQTTRNQIRGVLNQPDSQVVFLDTPGIHKPRTLLGERLNDRAIDTFSEVDVICLVIEANASIGPGDRYIAERTARASTPRVLVLNKVDRATPHGIATQLMAAPKELGEFDAFVPLSARTGDGVDRLLAEVLARMPEGPRYYPDGMITDQPETFLVAEIVREKLLAVTRDEVPHSIAVVVEEVEERANGTLAIRAVIQVERDSQKAIVIGRRGEVLKQIGSEARRELEALLGATVFLETHVKVEKDWQRRAHALDRLGY